MDIHHYLGRSVRSVSSTIIFFKAMFGISFLLQSWSPVIGDMLLLLNQY